MKGSYVGPLFGLLVVLAIVAMYLFAAALFIYGIFALGYFIYHRKGQIFIPLGIALAGFTAWWLYGEPQGWLKTKPNGYSNYSEFAIMADYALVVFSFLLPSMIGKLFLSYEYNHLYE